MASLPYGTHTRIMQGQAGDGDYRPESSTLPPNSDPNSPAYFMFLDRNGIIRHYPFYPTHSNTSMTLPFLPGSQPPLAIPTYGSGANPPWDSHETISNTYPGMSSTLNPGMLRDSQSEINTPGDVISAVPSPVPSTLNPKSTLAPTEHRCPHYYQQLEMPESSRSSVPIQCEWRNCPNRKGFKNQDVLMRHVKEQHIFPGLPCPRSGCRKTFKRSHRLDEHMSNHHKTRNTGYTAPAQAFVGSPATSSGTFMAPSDWSK